MLKYNKLTWHWSQSQDSASYNVVCMIELRYDSVVSPMSEIFRSSGESKRSASGELTQTNEKEHHAALCRIPVHNSKKIDDLVQVLTGGKRPLCMDK